MKLGFEYGHGLMDADLSDSTDVFIPGETVADPPCLPQDWDSLYAATLESIRAPIGMPPSCRRCTWYGCGCCPPANATWSPTPPERRASGWIPWTPNPLPTPCRSR